jgi:hypothetical protein
MSCDTWSLVLKKEYTMRMMVNRAVREVLGPKGKEVTGDEKIA